MKINNYSNPNAKNIAEGIAHVVSARVQEIKNLVGMGWTKQSALEYVKNSTTLGAKTWAQVVEAVA